MYIHWMDDCNTLKEPSWTQYTDKKVFSLFQYKIWLNNSQGFKYYHENLFTSSRVYEVFYVNYFFLSSGAYGRVVVVGVRLWWCHPRVGSFRPPLRHSLTPVVSPGRIRWFPASPYLLPLPPPYLQQYIINRSSLFVKGFSLHFRIFSLVTFVHVDIPVVCIVQLHCESLFRLNPVVIAFNISIRRGLSKFLSLTMPICIFTYPNCANLSFLSPLC